MFSFKRVKRKGSILVLGLLTMAILLLIGGIFLSLTVTNIQLINVDLETTQTFWLAYAGLMQILHDLEDNFADHQQGLIEIKFNEGICKVGTVPLQQQGVREILIVSTGYKGTGKSSISGRVKIDSVTDYVLFNEGDIVLNTSGATNYGSTYIGENAWFKSFYFFGPVHINGNLKTRILVHTDYHLKIIFAKSKNIMGPALSLSGILYYYPPTVNTTSVGLTDFGLYGGYGTIINDLNGIVAGEADIRPDADKFLLKYEDIIWDGRKINFGWNDVDYYPTYTSIPDKTIDTTSDYVFQDKDHLGYYIKIPYIDEIKEEKYRNYIDPLWHIKSTNFRNFACSKISFTNDCLAKKEVIADGKWDGVSVPSISDYTFNYSSSNRVIRNVYVVEYDKAKKYSDGTPYVSDSEQPLLNETSNWIFLPLSEYDPNSVNLSLSNYRKHPQWRAENGLLTLEEIRNQYLNWRIALSSAYNYHLGRRKIILDPRYGIPIDRKIKEVILGINDGISDGSDYSEGEVFNLGTNYGINIDAMIVPDPLPDPPPAVRKVIILPKMYYATGITATEYSWGNVNFRRYNDTSTFLLPPMAQGVIAINDGSIMSPPPLEYTQGDVYDKDYPKLSPDSDTLPDPYPFPNYNLKGYWDVYVRDQSSNPYVYIKKTEGIDYTVNLSNRSIQFFDATKPVVNEIVVINRRHNLAGDGPTDPDLNPQSYLFVKLYPPKTNTKILIDPEVEAVRINLDIIDKNNCPKDSRYPLGFIDYNKNGKQESGEPGKYGIIYSKVPLIVRGSPKVPVTIICEDDVYVQSINKEYTLDSSEAQPVGIISKKIIWIDYSTRKNNNADNSDKEVMLNKVALFTNATRLFHYGGTSPVGGNPIPGFNFMNKIRLVGSLCLMQKNAKGENSAYDKVNDYIDKIREGKYEGGEWAIGIGGIEYKHQSYANSFRYEPPRYMPVYFHKVTSMKKSVMSESAEIFYKRLLPYANENKSSYVSSDIYNELLTQIEK